MRNVYVCEAECRIHKNGNYLTVRKNQGKVADISLNEVRTLILFGYTQMTAQALAMVLDKGIDILFLSSGGRYRGRASSGIGQHVLMRIAQYDKWFCETSRLSFAKNIVSRKIQNQCEVLKNYRYRKKISQMKEIEIQLFHLQEQVQTACASSELLGLEGKAVALYFSCFQLLIPDYEFTKRQRRPAFDPVNALLNLTYTFLKNEIVSALTSLSFDVQLGFYHTVRSGRESLALDIMEPYRSIFADRFVIMLLNRKRIKKNDFYTDEDGMRLLPHVMKQFCIWFQQEMYETVEDGKSWNQKIMQNILEIRKWMMEEKQEDCE